MISETHEFLLKLYRNFVWQQIYLTACPMSCRLLTVTEESFSDYIGHKKPVDAQIKLVELVRFFMEVNIHQHATYFVDSLWDNSDVLRVRLLAPYHLYSLLNALSLLSLSPLSNPLSFSLCLTLSPLPFSPSYHIQNFSSFAF